MPLDEIKHPLCTPCCGVTAKDETNETFFSLLAIELNTVNLEFISNWAQRLTSQLTEQVGSQIACIVPARPVRTHFGHWLGHNVCHPYLVVFGCCCRFVANGWRCNCKILATSVGWWRLHCDVVMRKKQFPFHDGKIYVMWASLWVDDRPTSCHGSVRQMRVYPW